MQTLKKIPYYWKNYQFDCLILGFLAFLYLPLIMRWYDGWFNKNINIEHEYFSYGIIGLPFAVYLAWSNRHQWKSLPDRSHPLSVVFLFLSASFYLSNISQFVNLSFPLMLTGVCISLKGSKGLKLQAFPLLFVYLTTPNEIPYLLTPYTLPLQQMIAGVAGFLLHLFNIPVRVDDVFLSLNDRVIEIAPYCAGLKMLLTTFYVDLMILYWTGAIRSKFVTFTFFLSSAFLSVSGNIIRNTLLTLFHTHHQDQLFDWLHEGSGGDIYSAITLFLLIPLLNILQSIHQWSHNLSKEEFLTETSPVEE